MKLISSYFSKKYHFRKVDSFKLYISIIKSETPTLSLHLPKSYISQVNLICILCCHCLHHFSSFSVSHFESIMVNSQRLRIDTCYFYLGKLIHFRIKMPLLIGNLSWYFWKWQLAYLEYLCDIELSRIYFQISLLCREELVFYWIKYTNSLKYKVGCFWCFSYVYTILLISLSYRCLKNVIHQIYSKNEWLLLSVTFTLKLELVFVFKNTFSSSFQEEHRFF